jgi:hypothetical protein
MNDKEVTIMKKILFTLIVLSLFIFGMATSATAASPTQDTSCSGGTVYWNAAAG